MPATCSHVGYFLPSHHAGRKWPLAVALCCLDHLLCGVLAARLERGHDVPVVGVGQHDARSLPTFLHPGVDAELDGVSRGRGQCLAIAQAVTLDADGARCVVNAARPLVGFLLLQRSAR